MPFCVTSLTPQSQNLISSSMPQIAPQRAAMHRHATDEYPSRGNSGMPSLVQRDQYFPAKQSRKHKHNSGCQKHKRNSGCQKHKHNSATFLKDSLASLAGGGVRLTSSPPIVTASVVDQREPSLLPHEASPSKIK